jgi:UDP-sugar transporter A1/2/3
MILLALQFGMQPILTQKYAGKETSILKITYVGAQDVIRMILCALGLLVSVRASLAASASSSSAPSYLSSISSALASYRPSWGVLVPAGLYSLQNYCSITAYQALDAITYNVLNQTKTLFGALWCYALLRQRQSPPQMLALVLLVTAAFIMEDNHRRGSGAESPPGQVEGDESANAASTALQRRHRRTGVAAVLAASMTSGLAGAWTQRILQGGKSSASACNSLVFSIELSVISLLVLVTTSIARNTLQPTQKTHLEGDDVGSSSSTSVFCRIFRGWKVTTWIPVLTNAVGGILVGLVTKHAGVVPKGFALILGLFLAGVLQKYSQRSPVTAQQWVGGSLAALSLYLHAAFPASSR